jgi:type I site-specific restriction-modification system R (restriction) subunit
VVLAVSLRAAIDRLNTAVPAAAREDALKQVLDLGQPALLSSNRAFHRVLVTGVPVQYQKYGETRGDFVCLIDWQDAHRNERLAVQQFTIKGPRHTRRPDIILFINGLPLVLIELKNPADLNADIWSAYDQIQTYKAQVADVFTYNELLVIADGTEARMGSLSSNAERFMQWRTIDGVALDPLGKFQELETLVRGVLPPAYLLDYLRFFVLFEDDGTLVKKVAGYHQFHAVRAAVEQVVDIFAAVGLDKPNIGLLDDDFLAQVNNLPEKNLAVELLERLLLGEIKSRFASNVVQDRKFSDLLADVIRRYQNRSIETAQVMEELIAMAKKFREAANRGDQLGLREDEVKFYDALANNESAVRELQDETLKKIAQELTQSLRDNLTVDWSERESVRAKLRLMVKRILKKYKYPPDQAENAVELVLEQAQSLGKEWTVVA